MVAPVFRNLLRACRSVFLPQLQQGSTLSIRSCVPANITFQSAWRDNVEASLVQLVSKGNNNPLNDMIVKHDEDQITSIGRMTSHVSIDLRPGKSTVDPENDISEISVKSEESNLAEIGTTLTVQIPEKMNVTCDLEQGGSISVQGKVEGDAKLSTTDGDIRVTKLRGHLIELAAKGENTVYASNLLEAVKLKVVTQGRFRAKQVHGTDINVTVEGGESRETADPLVVQEADDEGSLIDISAIFVSGEGGASLTVSDKAPGRRAVRVKSHHGPLEVNTKAVSQPNEMDEHKKEIFPLVELGGVNGQFEVSMEGTKLPQTDGGWSSCLVHLDSLSPDSVSLAVADRGDVSVTVDRKVETDFRLLSMASGESLPESGALLAEEEDEEMVVNVLRHLDVGDSAVTDRRILTKTKAFTAKPTSFESPGLEYLDGYMENKSAEPDSRFERKVSNDKGSVGKIRLDGAADQALQGFSGSSTETDQGEVFRPLVAIAGTGIISVETVSWLGAIARRYGLEETERKPGRTAARRGRSFAHHSEEFPQ